MISFFSRAPRAVAKRAKARIAKGRFGRADRLLARSLRRHAGHPDLLEQYAYSAHNSGRYALARQRWDDLRARAPTHPMAWAGVACNERELGQLEAAGRTMIEALALFPGDEVLIGEASRVFARADIVDQQKARLEALFHERPGDRALQKLHVDVLLSRKRFAEAEALLGDLRLRFGDGFDHSARWADLALAQKAWRRAITIVECMRETTPAAAKDHQRILDAAVHGLAEEAFDSRFRDPAGSRAAFEIVFRYDSGNAAWTAGSIFALTRLGRVEEAGREMEEAMRRFPGEPVLVPIRALIQAKLERWDTAISLLDHHLARFPRDQHAAELLAGVKFERNCAAAVEPPSAAYVPIPQDVGLEHDDAKRELLLRFESLGENCEFGLVQRHYGAEPLSLFRWSSTTVADLTSALRAKLDGVGSVEHTSMSTWEEIEYFVADRRWGFATHTFCAKQEVAFDVLYPKMCKRLVYLRGKFLADMAAGEKIFLLRSDVAGYRDLTTLRDALLGQRPARLLCVKQVARLPSDAPPVRGGTVFEIDEGLYVGYLSRFGHTGVVWEILFDEWIAICRGIETAGKLPFASAAI